MYADQDSRTNAAADQAARENWSAYQRALTAGHDQYLKDAKKYDDFYLSQQWDAEAAAKLRKGRRPALTLNYSAGQINAAAGAHQQSLVDIKLQSRTPAQRETAQALTEVFRQIYYSNRYHELEMEYVLDGYIAERGWMDVRMDFEDNLLGEVRFEVVDPVEVLLDPRAKNYEPSTWNEVTRTRWMTLDEIAVLYGKNKAKRLESLASTGTCAFGADSIRFDRDDRTFGDESIIQDDSLSPAGARGTVRCVRTIERQHRRLTRTRVWVDPVSGDMRTIPDAMDDDRVAYIAQRQGLIVMPRVMRKVRWTVSADAVDLYDDWSPYDDFTLVLFSPFFRRGRTKGLMRDLISPQEQLNKTESQELHIVNSSANGGWKVQAGSLVGMTPQELEERGAETGLVIQYAKGYDPPDKIQPNTVPTGIDRLSIKAHEHLRGISGVDGLLAPSDVSRVSGVALQQRSSISLAQLRVPMARLTSSRRLVAQRVLSYVQRFYTEPRMLQYVSRVHGKEQVTQVAINQPTPAGEIVNNVTLGEYDLVLGTTPPHDTLEDAIFAEALSMRDAGVAIPDDVIVEVSHLENREDIAERMRRRTGEGQQSPEEQELQQKMLMLQLRAAAAEVEETEAKVERLRAEASLFEARATNEAQGPESEAAKVGVAFRQRLTELESDLERQRRDLMNKIQLAQIHSEAKRELTVYTAATKKMVEELRLKAQARSAPQEKPKK